jgi:hypothetical protein
LITTSPIDHQVTVYLNQVVEARQPSCSTKIEPDIRARSNQAAQSNRSTTFVSLRESIR